MAKRSIDHDGIAVVAPPGWKITKVMTKTQGEKTEGYAISAPNNWQLMLAKMRKSWGIEQDKNFHNFPMWALLVATVLQIALIKSAGLIGAMYFMSENPYLIVLLDVVIGFVILDPKVVKVKSQEAKLITNTGQANARLGFERYKSLAETRQYLKYGHIRPVYVWLAQYGDNPSTQSLYSTYNSLIDNDTSETESDMYTIFDQDDQGNQERPDKYAMAGIKIIDLLSMNNNATQRKSAKMALHKIASNKDAEIQRRRRVEIEAARAGQEVMRSLLPDHTQEFQQIAQQTDEG